MNNKVSNEKKGEQTPGSESSYSSPGQGPISAPSISLPKGGGAIRGIGEKFAANPVTGTGSMTVPIAASPGRSGFGPQLSLSYDSGAGNGPFGFGWDLSLPAITRKTDKGLPKYQDADESDTFILSGAEDLVPVLKKQGSEWVPEEIPDRTICTDSPQTYRIKRFRPRIEGLFARIERWTNTQTNETHWRSISRDNVVTVYGRTTDSRIEDPNAPEGSPHVFSWLICESYDDKGNAILYEYESENSAGIDHSQINERNRTDNSRSANRYLKRIKYGNKTPVEIDSNLPREFREDLAERADWLFEVVFDYEEGHYEEIPANPGDHQFVNAHKDPTQDWQRRQDPFSSYRSGFEVRTYRLCHRVLMFHHFPDELGVDDYLVRSTGFNYKESPIASFITSVTQSGYKLQDDGTYLKKSLPPLEFQYSEAIIQDKIQEIDEESLENLPQGLDGTQYQWADIDGEGLSGILTEQGDSWFFKRNISALPVIDKDGKPHTVARFTPTERLATIPSFTNLSEGRQQLLDLAGDGQLDVVELDSPTPGFYERTKDEAWHTFRPFKSLPNVSWQDPNLRFVDLTGDGHADIFITGDEVFTWYQSLAEAGFASGEKVRQALDEEKGPKLVFADGTQTVYLADISGDGLTDLVRIRNGEVCYWPNLGYGRFGAKVTMDNSPRFDAPDHFDQSRIRLADIDGSGVTDIIYLKNDGVYIYLNESGNRWTDAEKLELFPHIDNLSSVIAVDLLGNSTACLVWSSPLPAANVKSMRYIDLMGGQKPHLLVKMVNNLGAETHVHYSSSTRFYLADKLVGKPWITKIPFAVHVVERVETYDRISRNRFVTRYAYHHGYFDGIEREFRGFGMVEQWDTEEYAAMNQSQDFPTGDNIEESSYVPPVLTRTWFHTGAYIKGGRISRQFEKEYYREGDPSLCETGLSDDHLEAMLLEDTILPRNLSSAEFHEACRTLKGLILRQEIYALDSTEEEDRPYNVFEQNYTLKCLQPRGENKHAVFFAHARETIDFHYERKLYEIGSQRLADPRVTHTMNLVVDDFGNVLQSVAIGYGRRHDDPDPILTNDDRNKQKRMQITCTENDYTNPVLEDDAYRMSLLCETRTYELLKVTPLSSLPDLTNLFRFEEMLNRVQESEDGLHDIPYEDVDATGVVENHAYRRLIEHIRMLYRRNDLTGSLPLGELQSLALPFETYKLAFTQGLISDVYGGRVTDAMMENEGRYVHSEGDSNWWIPSGEIFLSPDSTDTFSEELNYASQHFFLPHRFKDPFEQITTVHYDSYDLLIQETRDALDNRVTAGERDPGGMLTTQGNDYRMLQPRLVMDPNRNRSAVAFDALGMVVGTSVMGKPDENLGDALDGFEPDLTDMVVIDHLQNPFSDPHSILQRATTRLVYYLFAFQRSQADPEPQPAVVYTLTRKTHDADLAHGEQTKIQHSFSFSDGFGREIQKKIQAEPGPLDLHDSNSPHTDPRWVSSGWTIFNNKGKPVRQYEPFFDDTHEFRFGKQVGVSPILFYDPLERVVATLHPNHTYEKVMFDPWRQETWDVNDTVLQDDPENDPDVGDFFARLQETDYLPTWHDQRQDGSMGAQEQAAANKAAEHANTPAVSFFDTLGRPFLTVAHNRFERNNTSIEEKYITRILLDIEGNMRAVIDARENTVMEYAYNILGPEDEEDEDSEEEADDEEDEEKPDSRLIFQRSMDAGERWILYNVADNPIRTWDSRNHMIRYAYDALQRQTHFYVQKASNPEILAEHTIYGETQAGAQGYNLRGEVFQQYDSVGVVTRQEYDFKGNILRRSHQLAKEYKQAVDWNVPDISSLLETEIFESSSSFDALNRVVKMFSPHTVQIPASEIVPSYNEANLLERVEARLRDSNDWTSFVKNIDYDAKGQRTCITYGNDVVTNYDYDKETFRLIHMQTKRANNHLLQDLYYTYDPSGNITEIRDNAQQTIYFNNQVVSPNTKYNYDAIYRLIKAEGREHIGQSASDSQINRRDLKPHYDFNDSTRKNLPHPNDGQAMRLYTELYEYDSVGNILAMIHQVNNGSWTRRYQYKTDNNQLMSTSLPGDPDDPNIPVYSENYQYSAQYEYDTHGNMIRMPHLPDIQWNYKDQMRQVDQGGGGTAYYVYDVGGQRVRKVHEHNSATVEERIYLGGFEIYRKRNSNGLRLERETLHIMDEEQRIAMVETKIHDEGSPISVPWPLIRYQLSNHLDSASLELDDVGDIISYEEYHSYGTTAYHATHNNVEVSPKHYRYTGKERDEETGLNYHGARYYAPWVGRWMSTDPAGIVTGLGTLRNQKRSINIRYGYTSKERDAGNVFISNGTRYLIAGIGRWNRPDLRYLHQPEAVHTQTYRGNHYAYALNNPLTYYDPDGDVPWAKTRKALYNRLYGDTTSAINKYAARILLQNPLIMPTYINSKLSKCRNDVMRFLANIGGPWRRWEKVYPDPKKGQRRIKRQLASNTRDNFFSVPYISPGGKVHKRWFVNIKDHTGAVKHTIQLKTGMVLTIAEGQKASGKYYFKHTIVWLGGPKGEFICDLNSSIKQISDYAPAGKTGFWGGPHFKVLMIEDPYKGKP